MSRRDLLGALEAVIRLVDNADSLDQVRRGTILERARAVAVRAKAGHSTPIPWTPFEETMPLAATEAQLAMMSEIMPSLDRAAARAMMEAEATETRLFTNSRYQVAMREGDHGNVHLSIKRIDQASVHDWRDLQRIKDELIGEECEAVELYPANSRVVDTTNQYHLWCRRDTTFRFPFGFDASLKLDVVSGGGHQRRRET